MTTQPADRSYAQLLSQLPEESEFRQIFPTSPTKEEEERFTASLQEAVNLWEAWKGFCTIADLFEAAAARLTSATEQSGHQDKGVHLFAAFERVPAAPLTPEPQVEPLT